MYFAPAVPNQNDCTSLELLWENDAGPLFFTIEQFHRVYDAHPTASQMVKFGASQATFCMLKAAFKNGKAEDRFSTSCSALYGAIHRLGRFDYSEIGHSLLKTDFEKSRRIRFTAEKSVSWEGSLFIGN